jgi:cytochrome c-type biogenesis protein CcmF
MNIGTGLIYASLILAISVLVLSIIHLILSRARNERMAEDFFFFAWLGSILLFVVVSMAMVLLYIYFLTSEVSIQYVWEYSAKAHPTEYKISGVLAGMAGSLLFWIWCMVFSWFVEEVRDLRKPRGKVLMSLTRTIMMVIITIFLLFLNSRELFKETPAAWLEASPDGNGLNPLLQTPLMIIHPPIVFLAYGFMVMGMAAAFAYLICKDKKWVTISIPWSRWGFLFLTLGIGIGGLWAYVVLGWGGYWAWDPVETSSFLPWMLLTAFLHAQLMFKRKGHYKFAAPALGIYTFVLVIFATFTTRAGGIWQSVHAFGAADAAVSPWDRFVDVVSSDSIIMGYFVLIIGISILGAVMLVWALIRWSTPEEDISDRPPKGLMEELINDKNLMFLTLIVITISTIVTLLLLILSINGADRTQFDSKVGFFAMIGVLFLANRTEPIGSGMHSHSIETCELD